MSHTTSEEIRALAVSLNKKVDGMAEHVRACEAQWQQCGVGVTVSVKVDRVLAVNALHYGRIANQDNFCVYVEFNRTTDGHKPWSDCERRVKIGTFAYLPALAVAVAVALKKLNHDADAVLSDVKSGPAAGGPEEDTGE